MKNQAFHVYQTMIDFDLLDPGGVVHHPNYLILCERARTSALMDANCSLRQLWTSQLTIALSECHARYFKPLVYEQKISVITQLLEYSGARLKIQQFFVPTSEHPWNPGFHALEFIPQGGTIFFEARLVLVTVKLPSLKITRLPEIMTKALSLTNKD